MGCTAVVGRGCSSSSVRIQGEIEIERENWGKAHLSRELSEVSVQGELVVQDLVSLDLNVRGLALGPSERLVNHDP